MTYLRSQIAKAADLNIETIRFYEKSGLIPVPDRTDSGYRIYTDSTLDRLEFIKYAKNSGFTLEEIKHLLSLLDRKIIDQAYISDLLDKKIEDIDRKVSSYIGMKEFLLKVKDNLYQPDKCPVIQSLINNLQA